VRNLPPPPPPLFTHPQSPPPPCTLQVRLNDSCLALLARCCPLLEELVLGGWLWWGGVCVFGCCCCAAHDLVCVYLYGSGGGGGGVRECRAGCTAGCGWLPKSRCSACVGAGARGLLAGCLRAACCCRLQSRAPSLTRLPFPKLLPAAIPPPFPPSLASSCTKRRLRPLSANAPTLHARWPASRPPRR
jgi:hypothetical protein